MRRAHRSPPAAQDLRRHHGRRRHQPERRRGEVLGFLARTCRQVHDHEMITGFLEPDSGRAAICGHDVQETPKLAKSKLGYVPEGAPSYSEMTIALSSPSSPRYAATGSRDRQNASPPLRRRPASPPFSIRPSKTLSKGYKRRVGVAQAILHDPPVLVMDEPTDGLDPNQKHHVRELIKRWAAEKAIIISTHILEEVEASAPGPSSSIVAPSSLTAPPRTCCIVSATTAGVSIRVPTSGPTRAIRILKEAKEHRRRGNSRQGERPYSHPRFARDGALETADVAAVLRAQQISDRRTLRRARRLDEVFRQITTSDDQKRESTGRRDRCVRPWKHLDHSQARIPRLLRNAARDCLPDDLCCVDRCVRLLHRRFLR